MSQVLSCEWTIGLMTEYLEGALPPFRLAGLRLHLGMCPPCRAILASLRRLPALLKEALEEHGAGSPDSFADRALGNVLSRIRAGEGRAPLHHPAPELWGALDAGRTDTPQRLLLELHLGSCANCRASHPGHAAHALMPAAEGGPPLPAGLKQQVLPESRWKWIRHGLGGARAAEVLKDAASGATLWLTHLPAGARLPRHQHWEQELAVVLDGWVQDGPYTVGPGDCLQHEGGTEHEPMAESADGCWVLTRLGPEGLRFKGWRRFFS